MEETVNNTGQEKAESEPSALISRNVRIHNRRTSVRLEPEMWDALKEISGLERCAIHDLCTAVYDFKAENMSFTAALRVFLMEYYRAASKKHEGVSLVQEELKKQGQASKRTYTETDQRVSA